MKTIASLKRAQSRQDLARILKVSPNFLRKTLYSKKISSHYKSFIIPKKSGGERKIFAPSDELKELQSKLSNLLLDCQDEILIDSGHKNTLAHGFMRNKSILTNAELHLKSQYVFNLDLKDFFGAFNFGRVRGFFIKDRNFELNEEVATTIAQIAILDNKLPQGSPCSPVITNLIANILDFSIVKLAKKYNCVYSRFADDITISTNKKEFPIKIARVDGDTVIIGEALEKEVVRNGFEINERKSRLQYKRSRQDVTGLVVNKKLGIKKSYRKSVRAMACKLFKDGEFFIEENGLEREGTLGELRGRLNFIDSVDRYNRKKKDSKEHELSSREKIFRDFIFYENFIKSEKPIILCEGKTDYIYIDSALAHLENVPKNVLPEVRNGKKENSVKFFKYTDRVGFFLGLRGGADNIRTKFLSDYKNKCKQYNGQGFSNPVILVFDNDDGVNGVVSYIRRNVNGFKSHDEVRDKKFIHVFENLYVVFAPKKNGENTEIEDFFDKETLNTKVGRKTFSRDKSFEQGKFYGKSVFAERVVAVNKGEINFDGFSELVDRISAAIDHFSKLSPSS